MNRLENNFLERFPGTVLTVDSHTAGEPTRLLVDGVPPLKGDSIWAKRDHFARELDHWRLLLTREPRGHRDMVAAVLTESVSPGADIGLFYMDARRYPQLCGHATIGAVTTLIETGMLNASPPDANIRVDTPSGMLEAHAAIDSAGVASVGIRMVPSYVHDTNQCVEVPGYGTLRVDVVYVGGFFAMVSAEQIGLDLSTENSGPLISLGMAVIDACNRQLSIRHPTRPGKATIDVTEFFEAHPAQTGRGKSVVIYGESHMDRSPCGTGTAAKLTLFHHQGTLALEETYINESPLGTDFEGRIVSECRIGDRRAVVAEIRGSAHITGLHRFVLDPRDPFPKGFLL